MILSSNLDFDSVCFVVKYFLMQNIFRCKWFQGKWFFFFFPCLVVFRKMLQKIFYSFWLNVKIKNKTHPNTTGMDKKPTTTSASHPTNPPRATRNRPRPTINQTFTEINQKPTRNPRDPLHKTKKSSSKSTKSHQLQTTDTPTPITNNLKLAKIKPKPQIW